MRLLPLLPLLPLLLATTPAAAQRHDAQAWLQVNTIAPLAERLRVTLEQIARWSDRQDGLYQTEFGGIMEWRAASNIQLGFGYRKVGFHNANRGANEDRLRQHVVAAFGPVTTRFRVDERFSDAGGEVGFRLRPLVRYNRKVTAGGLALFASHESFYLPNATRWGQRRGYERMRNILGLSVPISGAVTADVGYLNQYRLPRGGARAEMDHALTIQVSIATADVGVARADD